MLRVPFATIEITAFAVGVRPTAALAVDHELQPAAGLIRQCKPVTQQPLLLDVFVDGALVDFACETFGRHFQRDVQRDKIVEVSET